MSQGGWVKPDFVTIEASSSKVGLKRFGVASKVFKAKKKVDKDDDKLWVNKYQADCLADLVVQKKKVAEVQLWVEQALGSRRMTCPMLLLTGPSGCGKYQTLSLICRQLGVEIYQWEEPIRYSSTAEWEYNQSNQIEGRLYDMNPMDHLKDFMSRANRYSALPLKGATNKTPLGKKLVLIKDLPTMVHKNAEAWHELVRQYSTKGKTPIVFIVTEANSNFGTTMKLFPTDLQEAVSLSAISLNSLANTFVTKALQRVLLKESACLPTGCRLEDVVESCNGDLRCAINTLQWLCTRSAVGVATPVLASKKRKMNAQASSSSTTVSSVTVRDGSLDFMHALGKILYCKRGSACEKSDDQQLPEHLSLEKRIRLQENVDTLVDKMNSTPPKVLLYLHQNFPAFFSNIEDIAAATQHLSSADLLTGQYLQESLDEYPLLVAVRGMMHSNTEVCGGSWRPLRKPDYYAVEHKARDLLVQVRQLWPLTNDAQFFSETVPYMSRLMSTLALTAGQRAFVQQVGVCSNNNRLAHAVVAGKPSGLVADGCGTLDCSKSNVDQVDDEQVLIEDYDD